MTDFIYRYQPHRTARTHVKSNTFYFYYAINYRVILNDTRLLLFHEFSRDVRGVQYGRPM